MKRSGTPAFRPFLAQFSIRFNTLFTKGGG